MFTWIKKLRGIVAKYEHDRVSMQKRIAELEETIRQHTTIGVDVGFRDSSYVVMVGRYRGHDYVQTFNMNTSSFEEMVDVCRRLQKMGAVRRVDAPPALRGAFKREMEW